MVEAWAEKRVVISPDPSTLADSVAARFLSRVAKRTGEGKLAHISLTGGSMGAAVLEAAARHPRIDRIDWSFVHFWWSDERFLPAADEERNEKQARTALLDAIDVPTANIHAIAADGQSADADSAASEYAAELARYPGPDGPWPAFDVCFLGVGPDAHIASLFPDRPEIQIKDRSVVPVHDSPKPPAERVTMTRPVINGSKRVWMVVSGADKASALGLALAGASYASVPAAGAKGRKRTIFFVDEAAASQVPPELIDREY
ncbi:6-phosphogluconolactonase [Microbacterium sp. HD4P20]|uniref:6-phosphogluconolactonase n=1 Tax=Microbacterium sp. HD4P20 TaxID=2864874 RepID=UPI001C63E6AD|nr:6-phosphogluconolactonase [Microbacterium sp. HD4P20]MCP2637060.1 6-phosphogluconolactonase [Microbacterium sp. HD4P20]